MSDLTINHEGKTYTARPDKKGHGIMDNMHTSHEIYDHEGKHVGSTHGEGPMTSPTYHVSIQHNGKTTHLDTGRYPPRSPSEAIETVIRNHHHFNLKESITEGRNPVDYAMESFKKEDGSNVDGSWKVTHKGDHVATIHRMATTPHPYEFFHHASQQFVPSGQNPTESFYHAISHDIMHSRRIDAHRASLDEDKDPDLGTKFDQRLGKYINRRTTKPTTPKAS